MARSARRTGRRSRCPWRTRQHRARRPMCRRSRRPLEYATEPSGERVQTPDRELVPVPAHRCELVGDPHGARRTVDRDGPAVQGLCRDRSDDGVGGWIDLHDGVAARCPNGTGPERDVASVVYVDGGHVPRGGVDPINRPRLSARRPERPLAERDGARVVAHRHRGSDLVRGRIDLNDVVDGPGGPARPRCSCGGGRSVLRSVLESECGDAGRDDRHARDRGSHTAGSALRKRWRLNAGAAPSGFLRLGG